VAVSVEKLLNTLARSHILNPDEVRVLRDRWKRSAGANDADGDAFLRWLTENKVLTEHQIGVLGRGNADQLILGSYVIQERIGKGRMAGVYRARHRTGQTVAIKILPPSKARDPLILGRFQRESRLALRLKHPNIVRTFQAGEHNGLHFIVMEYLEGEPFDEVLARRGKLPPAEAVRVVHQVLLGLDELHEKGMIHRDVKPANMMIVGGQPDNTTSATIKILDVGTGKADFDEGPTTELTNEGDLLGTPEYMAPEQARDPRHADVRADVYSSGCVLYHALAGRPPFNDANRVRLLVKHATEAPRPIRELNPAVPEGLQQILDWMLAKDPAARYPTPHRAAQALQVFLAAGSESGKADLDESMKTYLGSLAKEEDQDSINVELVAVALPVHTPVGNVPVAAPVAPPVRSQPAPPARSQPAPQVAPPVAQSARQRQPAPPPPPAPPVAPPVRSQSAPPVAQATRPPVPTPAQPRAAKKVRKEQVEDEEEQDESKGGPFGLSRRDFVMLLIGIAAVAVFLSIGLAVFAIVSSRGGG
jgi:eukaryotic-like serine/threonine-protein kinase